MFPRSWTASRPSSAWLSIAKAWFLHLPKRWPVPTASCARKRTHSHSARRPDESAGRVSGHRPGLAQRLSPTAHVRPRRATGARVADLSRAPLPDSDHLDQWRPEPQLERGVFPPLALPVGATAVVSAYPATCFGLLPATPGRRGHRRYPVAEDRTLDSADVLSARSFVAAVSCQPCARLALPAGLPAGASVPKRSRRHAGVADSFPGGFPGEAPRQESHRRDAPAVQGSGETEEFVAQLRRYGKTTQARTGRCRRA